MAHLTHRRQNKARVRERRINRPLARIVISGTDALRALIGTPRGDNVFVLPDGVKIEWLYPETITPTYWLLGYGDEISKAILGEELTKLCPTAKK